MQEEFTMWECGDCGNIKYGEFPPNECSKCWRANSFLEVPETIRTEKNETKILRRMKRRELDEN